MDILTAILDRGHQIKDFFVSIRYYSIPFRLSFIPMMSNIRDQWWIWYDTSFVPLPIWSITFFPCVMQPDHQETLNNQAATASVLARNSIYSINCDSQLLTTIEDSLGSAGHLYQIPTHPIPFHRPYHRVSWRQITLAYLHQTQAELIFSIPNVVALSESGRSVRSGRWWMWTDRQVLISNRPSYAFTKESSFMREVGSACMTPTNRGWLDMHRDWSVFAPRRGSTTFWG